MEMLHFQKIENMFNVMLHRFQRVQFSYTVSDVCKLIDKAGEPEKPQMFAWLDEDIPLYL